MEQIKTPNGQMPTGIYSAADALRQRMNGQGAALNMQATPPAFTTLPESEVPATIAALPRGRSLRMQWRYLRVLAFAAQLFIRILFWQIYVRRYFPRYVEQTNSERFVRYARQFRGFAISLGGVFIKLGQFISTRVDALPEAITRELESLQDEVPTIPFHQIKGVIERELGPLKARYSAFNETPIAAASLGQAHRARLLNGDKVVIKVQRPGIRATCYTDLAALKIVAWVAMKFEFISRRADAIALTEEFGRVLLEELSYAHEAKNALIFADFFKEDMGVYIPTVYTEHSTDRVLTLEDVTTIKITDYAALEQAGISRKAVAKRLMDTYLRQIFELFFFHADPHPGNLFIYPLPVDHPEQYIGKGGRPFYLIFIDFGMTGHLTREIADGMVNTLLAVLARDADRLVRGYNDLGFILPGADLQRITDATRAAFNEVWGLSMTEIRDLDFNRAAHLANEFNDLIKSMPFYLPQDFIYLGRTISILSGMATTLDNSFNPWSELEPYAQRLAAQGFGVDVKNGVNAGSVIGALLSGSGQEAIQLVTREVIRRANPLSQANAVLNRLEHGEIRVIAEPSSAYKAQHQRLESAQRTTSRAVVFGAVLITSTLFYTHGDLPIALIGYGFCALSAITGWLRG
ncbi:MAG: AarF/UbiB family protein [Anaerolineae bacterium]|nr:AarF/UbiB family protein [Anaerolineae bacterium]